MKKLRKIILVILFVLLALGINRETFAIEGEENTDNYSKLYREYLNLSDEEKSKVSVIPRKYNVSMDALYKKQAEKYLKTELRNMFRLRRTQSEQQLPASFILLKYENTDIECEQYGGIDIQVEDQQDDGLCWAFASIKALETNLAVRGKDFDFSERHVDFLTSGKYGGIRAIGDGGTFELFEQYIQNYYGPVSEKIVPYSKKYNEDEYEYFFELQPEVYVEDTINFPTIIKDGENNYTQQDLNLFREAIKEHIVENGGIYADICAECKRYNNKVVLNYNGDNRIDHAITIIGWDDNFSQNNFPEECRPTNKGAYIAVNSWGNKWGDNGIFYISYEDKYVEADMSGIINASDSKDNYEIIEFQDENLYKALKDAYKKKLIGYDDSKHELYLTKLAAKSITKLDLSNKNILNINGLEEFENLKSLKLNNNNISDIESLSALINLNELDLSNNNIDNINNVQNLINLRELNLSNNNINNISSLQNLTNIRILDLSSNNIRNISYLPEVSSYYENLILSNNPIEIIEKDIHEVRRLYLNNCNIDNTKLEKIYSKVESSARGEIYLRNNNITDFSYFDYKDWDERTIDLSGNKQFDFNKLPKVGKLIIQDCNITDTDIIANNFSGYSLDLSYNPIEDITNISTLNLYSLNISYTKVKDVNSLNNVKELKISGNSEIEGVKNLTLLKSLEMNSCSLNDELLSQTISELKMLEELSINNNNISNLECLSNCKLLHILSANNNNISDINYFTTCKIGFDKLDLSNNSIIDITPLESFFKYITELNLSGNKIDDTYDITSIIKFNNEDLSTDIEIEKNRISKIKLPKIMNTAFKLGAYSENVYFICENCSINGTATEASIKSDVLERGETKIKIVGGNSDGTTYTINYNTLENINVRDIRIKSEAYRTNYLENENFDANGLKVEVTYENGLSEETTEYTLFNNTNLNLGQENIIIRSNKNPEIEITHPIKVYKDDEVEEIKFEDINLYNCIKNRTKNDDFAKNIIIIKYDDENKLLYVPKENIEKLNCIYLQNQNISSISGLEKFSKLEEIHLYGNADITNVDNLLNMEKLRLISLSGKNINDIEEFIKNSDKKELCFRMYDDLDFTDENTIELNNIIYQSIKLQEGVSVEAKIIYLDDEISEWKEMDVTVDDVRKVVTVNLDKEITEEHVPGTRCILIQINGGKTNGSSYEIRYRVKKELEKIEVIAEPSKLSYRVGQNFDPSWMKVKATYNSGETKEITDYDIIDGDNLTQDKKEVTISYEYDGITKTTTQPINVYTEEKLVNINFIDTNLYNEIKTGDALQNNPREVRKNLIVYYNDETNTVQMVKEILDKVDNLYLMKKDIRDLSGIENFVNLTNIDLSFNENLQSIDELLLLEKLKMVDIHVTAVENVKELINKDNIEKIILRKHEQNIINAKTEEIELPEFIYQAVTEENGVIAKANIYYDTYSPEDGEYYNKIDGEKEETQIIIDRENKKAIAKLNRQITSGHDEGIRGLEVEIEGGKCNGALYIAFYNNIEKINIVEAPTKTRYLVGQSFNPAGMKLSATYRDNSVSEIKDYTVVDGENLKEGQNNVTISYTENGLTKTTTQGIIVRNEEDEKVLNDDSKYYTDESKILGISPDTIISEFINNFNMKYRIIITKNDNEVTEGIIGTGMEIKILENDEEKAKYTAIVVGDTNGDGNANVKDMVKINNYRLYGTTTNFEEIYQKAADVNKDSKIDVKDMIRINNYRLYNTSLVD